MLERLSFIDLEGTEFFFSVGEDPPLPNFPVFTFETEVEYRNTRNNKMQAHGAWPAPVYMGAMSITIEGATMAQSYTDFYAFQTALKAAINPKPDTIPRLNTKIGTLKVKAGTNPILETDVTLDSFTGSQYDGNQYTEWQIIWYSYDPYFIQSIDAQKVFI